MTPVDYEAAYVIESRVIIPKIQELLKIPVVKGFTLGNLLIAIWITGALIKFVHTTYALCKTVLVTKKFKVLECPQTKRLTKLPFFKHMSIVVTPDVAFPMVTGVFRAHVFLPVLDVTDDELEMILRHEAQH